MDKITQDMISQINTWEQEAIKKIQNAAEKARHDLQQILDNHTEQLNEPQKLLNINDDKDPSIIHLIEVNHTPTIDALSLNQEEKFDKVLGAATLSEDGLVATHSGFIFGCSNISGINLYSSGIHQIHFRLEKTSSTCPFFGIYSSSQEMTTHILSSPSVYGWWEFNQIVVKGQKYGCQTNKIFQSGDEITLTLDCITKHISLRHHRTNKIVQHVIDSQSCPLPWKILVRLYGAVSRVRILQ